MTVSATLSACRHLFARSRPDPFAVTHGVLDALEASAIARGETQAIHRIREARKTVTSEALKPAPSGA